MVVWQLLVRDRYLVWVWCMLMVLLVRLCILVRWFQIFGFSGCVLFRLLRIFFDFCGLFIFSIRLVCICFSGQLLGNWVSIFFNCWLVFGRWLVVMFSLIWVRLQVMLLGVFVSNCLRLLWVLLSWLMCVCEMVSLQCVVFSLGLLLSMVWKCLLVIFGVFLKSNWVCVCICWQCKLFFLLFWGYCLVWLWVLVICDLVIGWVRRNFGGLLLQWYCCVRCLNMFGIECGL